MVASGVAELQIVGGHRALDLVNTVEPRLPAAGRHEHLATRGDLLLWAQRAAMIDSPEARAVADAWNAAPAAASAALTSVKQIRDALSVALSAVIDPGPAAPGTESALEYLSLRWAATVARSNLVLNEAGRPGARLIVGSLPTSLIPDRAAESAVELLCDVDLTHLGICPPEQHGCGWLFLDRSRNGSRRWCTMGECGAYAKSRRLTERRRATRATGKNPDRGSKN
jgi:predicted RNA-binding Zn ribbon-like protein